MGGRLAFAASLALIVAVPAAGAATGHESEVADAVSQSPVYVAPARADVLGPSAVGRLQLLIVHKDIGRIKIAVVPRAWAQQAGGVGNFASGVDGEMDLRGALIVVADDARHDDVHVTTSHVHVDEVVAGVQHAFDGGGTLEQKLARSVRALATADPGPSGDTGTEDNTPANATTLPGLPDANHIVGTVGHTIVLTTILIILAVLAPFAFIGGWFVLRARRARAEGREAFSDDLEAARQERAKLGDDIVDLDEATSGADVPAGARTAYEQALDAYDRSEQLLEQCDSPRRLATVKQLVADGRRAAAQAHAAVTRDAPAG